MPRSAMETIDKILAVIPEGTRGRNILEEFRYNGTIETDDNRMEIFQGASNILAEYFADAGEIKTKIIAIWHAPPSVDEMLQLVHKNEQAEAKLRQWWDESETTLKFQVLAMILAPPPQNPMMCLIADFARVQFGKMLEQYGVDGVPYNPAVEHPSG